MKRTSASKNFAEFNYQNLEPRQLLASFFGTNGNDEVVVTFEDGAPRFVEINGQVFDNFDATASLNLLEGEDQLFLVGQKFNMQVSPGNDATNQPATGNVNDVLTFRFFEKGEIHTDQFVDYVEISGSGQNVDDLEIYTGAGQDLVELFSGSPAVVSTGAGIDHFRLFNDAHVKEFDGGAQKDTLEFIGFSKKMEIRDIVNGQIQFGNILADTSYTGVERIVAAELDTLPEDAVNEVTSAINVFGDPVIKGINWKLDGDVLTSTDSRVTKRVELENFNKFEAFAPKNAAIKYRFSIAATEYPIVAHGFNRLELGYARNARTGDTSRISHDIDYINDDGSVPETIVVSNYRGNSPLNIEIVANEIRGVTPTRMDLSLVDFLTVWGSNTANDTFTVKPSNLKLAFYAGGGDDVLMTPANIPLDFTKQVSFVGGEGHDLMLVDDSDFSGDFSYRLRDNWVQNYPTQRSDSSTFNGIWHREVNHVTIEGTRGSNTFLVHPTDKYTVQVNGNGPHRGVADWLALAGNPTDFETNLDTQTISFGDETYMPIMFSGMERVQGGEVLAVGSRAGGNTIVEIRDAKTFETRSTIAAYTNPIGVNAATGNINGGARPDVIVGSTEGRARVKVFDGDSGEIITQFFPFESTDGVDVAVGNVLGNHELEIIVSQLNGGNEVRVFRASYSEAGELNYELARTLEPFAGAPAVGTRVAVGDFNFDNYDDIVSVPANGWLPQVAVHTVVGESTQLHRFLAHRANYTGGLNVAVGNLLGNPKSDIVVSFRGDSHLDNIVKTFRGERLFRDSGSTTLDPDRRSRLFEGHDPTNVHIQDSNFDGEADVVFAMAGGESSTGQVDVLDNVFSNLDSFFADDAVFENGGDLG